MWWKTAVQKMDEDGGKACGTAEPWALKEGQHDLVDLGRGRVKRLERRAEVSIIL